METPLEQGTPPISKYWLKIPNLTIYEAAFWMAYVSDPRSHKKRCLQDEAYADYFNERLDDVSDAIEIECDVVFGAIYGGFIKTTEDVHPNNNDLTPKTRLQKTSWITWCRDNGYCELADLFEPTQEGNHSATTNAEATTVKISIGEVPGKMPRTAIGKLAIKASWEIECATAKQATANQVIARLEEWIDAEPILFEKIPHGIRWITTNSTEADFSLEACAKALSKWKLTRP